MVDPERGGDCSAGEAAAASGEEEPEFHRILLLRRGMDWAYTELSPFLRGEPWRKFWKSIVALRWNG